MNLIKSTALASLLVFIPMSCAPSYVKTNSPHDFREARYDSSGFPIYGYQNNRPIYGYNPYGAPIFALALLTAACFVPSWSPAHSYRGHYHYPYYVQRSHSIPACAHSYRQQHYPQHQRDHRVENTLHQARPHANSSSLRNLANGTVRTKQYTSAHSPSSSGQKSSYSPRASKPCNTNLQHSNHNSGRSISPSIRSGSSHSARLRSSR